MKIIIIILIVFLFCIPVFSGTARDDIKNSQWSALATVVLFCIIPIVIALFIAHHNKKEDKRKYGK